MGGFPIPCWYVRDGYKPRLKALMLSVPSDADNYAHFVYCQKCNASGPVITGNEVEPDECRWDKAREAWNKRTQ